MSRTISRGTCSTRPGNDALSLELYPLYHAFVSAANLRSVMMDIAEEHKELGRFDPQMMRTVAEEVYGMSGDAQAAEGLVRRDSALLAPHLKELNTMYKWPLLQKIAADWAPVVRYHFMGKEGELLGCRPLYGAGEAEGMTSELIMRRLGDATNQQRCPTAEIPLTRWPLQAPSGPPTFAAPMPLRPNIAMGPRGNAPGLVGGGRERLVPGPVATQLCSQRGRF